MSNVNSIPFSTAEMYANDNNVTLQRASVILQNGTHKNEEVWPKCLPLDGSTARTEVNFIDPARGDFLTEIATALSDQIKFPASTAFLHGLGVIASALTKEFSINYYGSEIPVNAFVITSQPAGTGKSTVNEFFAVPIMQAYAKINKDNESLRRVLTRKVMNIEKDLTGKVADKLDEFGLQELTDKLIDAENRLAKIPHWKPILTNTTIEAAEMVASRQGGLFNIVSAEAGAIKVITGSAYGEGGKLQDCNLLLNAWDNEYFSGARVSRDAMEGNVRASIAVIAQDGAIEQILRAGGDASGLTERFFLLAEDSLLGHRNEIKRKSIDPHLKSRYEQLIKNILEESNVVLTIDDLGEQLIQRYTSQIEPELKKTGLYGNRLLASFMSKADKHIKKIACILHCVDNWQHGGEKSRDVNSNYIGWAIGVFKRIAETYINASAYFGYTGKTAELERVKLFITSKAERNGLRATVNGVRNAVAGKAPFVGVEDISAKLKNEILPTLESANYIVLDGSDIYINPRLK